MRDLQFLSSFVDMVLHHDSSLEEISLDLLSCLTVVKAYLQSTFSSVDTFHGIMFEFSLDDVLHTCKFSESNSINIWWHTFKVEV